MKLTTLVEYVVNGFGFYPVRSCPCHCYFKVGVRCVNILICDLSACLIEAGRDGLCLLGVEAERSSSSLGHGRIKM